MRIYNICLQIGKIAQNPQSEPHGLPEGVHWYVEGELLGDDMRIYNICLQIGKIAQNPQSEPHGLPEGVHWYVEGELCVIMSDFNICKN